MPTGLVDMKVPAGSDTGRKLRLHGRGLGRNPGGDLYLELVVHKSVARNAEDEALYRQLSAQMAFDSRSTLMTVMSR
jgi:curved DNA-binding protein